MRPKPITVVAGFGRCGSSLVMQMLSAGGMPTPYSEYPSFEIPQGTKVYWPNFYGGAVKILDPHIHQPVQGPEYRFIWIDRDPVEQAKSMVKFMEAAGMPGINEDGVKKLAASFKRDRPRVNGVMLEYTQPHRILKLRFEDILYNPAWAAHILNGFCGNSMLDERAMAAAVRPRGPKCLPYMLEFEQMEEAKHGPK